jgi:hypothetical protein
MSRFTRLCRAVGVGLAVAAATLSMTQVAHAALPSPTVPDAIKVSAGNEAFLVGHVSTGVQIYKCDGTTWTFIAPRADLVDDKGQLIIKHFAGPTWQATDGSSVVGAKVAGVTVDPNAVPWLLLKAAKTTAGPGGNLLAPTTFIQRINTVGGIAPTEACNAAKSGTVKEVPYKADYFFYKSTKG